jgi:hypothetical protein
MKRKAAQADNRFAFYHQNEALLFQFLLHECLCAHQILRKRPSFELFSQFVGRFECKSTTWQAPNGHLPRLLHYSFLLATHFENTSSALCKNLGAILERSFLTAKKCHESFNNEKEHSKLYAILRREIRAFMKLLLEKLNDFRDNASVLYFLLRHQEQFDAMYKEPIIRNIFLTFFPEGLGAAQLFLVEKFSKKGCNHLIPYIEDKLQKLDCPRASKRKNKRS